MALRVGINGFGRLGRLVLRAGLDAPDLEFVAVHDIADPATLTYLLQYDSVHGILDRTVTPTEEGFVVDGQAVQVIRTTKTGVPAWGDLGVDLVIETSPHPMPRATTLRHTEAGARCVLVTSPMPDADVTVVMGVNDHHYHPQQHTILSTASCTTQTLAVLTSVLHRTFGIERGMLTAVQAYTPEHMLLDAPAGSPRRSRAAALNLVPTPLGTGLALDQVVPGLAGRIEALAIHTPSPAGSLLDLTLHLRRPVDTAAVNATLEAAADDPRLQDVLLVSADPLVSSDIIGMPYSAIVDAESTLTAGKLAKVLAWYDHEWAYSCRVVDLAVRIGQNDG